MFACMNSDVYDKFVLNRLLKEYMGIMQCTAVIMETTNRLKLQNLRAPLTKQLRKHSKEDDDNSTEEPTDNTPSTKKSQCRMREVTVNAEETNDGENSCL